MSEPIDIDPHEICERGVITAEEVAILRRGYYSEGVITADEADALFAINNATREQAPDWPELFVEALTDYIVQQAEPQGYITIENAEWLIARISVDGIVQTRTELELLIHVLEVARWAPPSLARFALEQVKQAILARAEPDRRPTVTAADVQTLRRVLYAYGSDGMVAITRPEAEVLFAIAEAVDEPHSDPSWPDLFAKAVASSVMVESGYVAPSREAVLKQEAWLEEDQGTAGFLGRLVEGGLSGVWHAWSEPSADELMLQKLERDRQAMLVAEAVTQPEATWLAERIGRDGTVTDSERALLRFLKRESQSVHPALQPLLDRAA